MLQLTLLGIAKVELDGQVLAALHQSPRAMSLLAYLAIHVDQSQPRSVLAAVFWPDMSETQARRNVTNLVWRLQKILGTAAQHLQVAKESICLLSRANGESCQIDTALFRTAAGQINDIASLELAVNLYHGDLLQGFGDDWIEDHARQLQELYQRTLRQLTSVYRKAGKTALCIQTLRRWVQSDPFDEDAHQMLVAAYIEAGQGAEAVQAYQSYERIWQSDLNLAPSTRMQRLIAPLKQTSQPPSPQRRPIADSESTSMEQSHMTIISSACQLARLFKGQYLYEEALHCYKLAFQHLASAHFGDQIEELNLLRECDEIFDTLGDRARQSENVDRLALRAHSIGEPKDVFDAKMRRTWLALVTDEFVQAQAEANAGLHLCDQAGLSETHRATAHRFLGIASFNAGSFQAAKTNFETSLAMDTANGNAGASSLDLINLASVQLQFCAFQSALDLIDRVRSTTPELSLSIRTRIAGLEGTALLYLDEAETARKMIQKAITWSRQLGDNSLERWLALKLCLVWITLKRLDRAEQDAQYYLQQAKTAGGVSEYVEWIEIFARVYLGRGDPKADLANDLARKGIRIVEKNFLDRYKVLLYVRLAQSQHLMGQARVAKNTISHAVCLFHQRKEPMLEQDELFNAYELICGKPSGEIIGDFALVIHE